MASNPKVEAVSRIRQSAAESVRMSGYACWPLEPPQNQTHKEPMTTVPNEINAAAVKNSPTEKVTPMMAQYSRLLK
jgi:hypothetical protein